MKHCLEVTFLDDEMAKFAAGRDVASLTNAIRNSTAASHSEARARMPYCGDGAVERQGVDRQAGVEYVPMDVFVDPKTIRQHFRCSSACTR